MQCKDSLSAEGNRIKQMIAGGHTGWSLCRLQGQLDMGQCMAVVLRLFDNDMNCNNSGGTWPGLTAQESVFIVICK